jgi:glycosyltransferase involved in cell wall biosynthesis
VRLVLACSVGGAGGAVERQVRLLARQALRDGWEPAVLAPAGSLLEALEREGVRTLAVPFRRALDVGSLVKVRRALRRLSPHVVHAHDPRALLAVASTAAALVYSDHNSSTAKTAAGFFDAAPWWRPIQPGLSRLLRRADLVIAASQSCVRDLRDRLRLRGRAEVVHYGADPAPVAEVRPGTIAVVSRLSHEKGVDVAVRAMAHVPGARLVVAGEGPERARLASLAAGAVEFLGWVDDPAPVLAAAACVCVPSRWDNAPLVVADALLAGRPVVGAAVGGIPELIADGDGALVAPDDPLALARALELTLSDPGDAAARRVRALARFGSDRAWADHRRLYESVA